MPEAVKEQLTDTSPFGDGEIRSVAQLKMLQSLAAKLNKLNDVSQIGEAIAAELRTLIDYHNCRVYLIAPDGHTMVPIAFRGSLGLRKVWRSKLSPGLLSRQSFRKLQTCNR